jgi:hypothetical protein
MKNGTRVANPDLKNTEWPEYIHALWVKLGSKKNNSPDFRRPLLRFSKAPRHKKL